MRKKRSMYAVMIHILVMAGWLITNGNAIAQTEPEPPTATDAYEFPVNRGMPEWDAFESSHARHEALQVPEEILTKMSTAGLVETCLAYPFLDDMTLTFNYEEGLERTIAGFSGLRELFMRLDAGLMLLEQYKTMDPEIEFQKWGGDNEKPYPPFQFLNLEIMLGADSILTNLPDAAKISLLREALRVFRAKQASEHYAEYSLTPPVLIMARILEKMDYAPLRHRIAAIPPETKASLRQQILETRPELKTVPFDPIVMPIQDQYQSFLRRGPYGSPLIPEAIVLSAEEYLDKQEQGGK